MGNNTYAFSDKKDIAWGGIGVHVDGAMTSKEAISLAKLDYEVKKFPLFAEVDMGEHGIATPELSNNYATGRADNGDIFGVVGNRYEIIQNNQAFEFFDDIVGDKVAMFETAGALGKGEKIFITAKLPQHITVGKDDIENYLLLSSTHDGSGSIQVMFTPIRVVCNNTLNMALQSATNKVSIRHTKSVKDKLDNAATVLGIANNMLRKYEDVFNAMAKKRIDDNKLKEIIGITYLSKEEMRELAQFGGDMDATVKEAGKAPRRIISTRKVNIIKDVYEYAMAGPGQQTPETEGTLYGAVNAITGYYQNAKEFSSQEAKFNSNLYGANNKTMQKSFDIALSYLNNI